MAATAEEHKTPETPAFDPKAYMEARNSGKEPPRPEAKPEAKAETAKPAEPEEKPKARIGYGAEYALAVHERIEVHHADGTQAKFMSTPIDAAKASFKEKVAARIKEEVEK